MNDKYVLVKRHEITPELRRAVLRRDNFTCRYCGGKREPLHLDHVYPVAKGGETSEENLVTSCLRCNVKKHAKTGVFPKPIGYFAQRNSRLLFAALAIIVWNIVGIYSIIYLDVSAISIMLFWVIFQSWALRAQIDYFSTGKNS